MSSLIKKAGLIRLLCMLSALAQPGWLYADNSADTCDDDNATVNEDADNTCYTVSPPESAGAIDVTDGAETGTEWSGAKSKNLQGTMTGTFKVLRSGSDALYLLITANDSSYNASDVISVYFDVQHNHGTTTDDVQFQIKRDNGGSPNHEKSIGGVSAAWNPATLGSELGRGDGGASWTAELRLTAAELGVSDLPAIVGFGVSAFNLPGSTAASWPVNFDDTVPATTWANLKNRFPIEYMMVLDQSGSMLDPSVSGGTDRKWDIALNAADYLANAIGILQNTVYFSDQLCAATFAWNCSGSDTTMVAKSCSTVSAFPVGNYTSSLSDPVWTNCTPIGSGLDIGFETLGTSSSEETQRVMLFLSDGLHNRPDSSLTPDELDYSACSSAGWTSCPDSTVQVNTVALGQGGGIVDEALLSKIKDHFSGSLHTTYNITNNPTDLKEAFIGSLDELYRMNIVYSGSPASDFTVDEDNQRLIVVASWNTAASAATFKLQRDTGGGTWVDVTCDSASAADTTVGFAVCAVTNPAQGQWRARTTGNTNLTANGMFVLMDLNLRARFLIEQAVHGTGMDIILTADLNQGGAPLTNDATHPVTVTVDIEKPDQGMGSFLSTTDPATCKRMEPIVPRVNVDNNKVYVSPAQQPGVSAAAQPAAGAAAAASSGGGDPAAAYMQLAQQLLDACNLDHLPRNVLASLQLVDDGTQGDVTANDGIYTLRFNNTEFEGSYVFRFKASGSTLNGNAFTRTRAAAEYVQVEVDPAASGSGSQTVSQSGTVITQLHYVIPRDRFGGYLGPGRIDQVKFIVSGAQLVGGVLDFNNGIYGQVIRFDSRVSTPAVIPVVQDKPVVDKKVFCGMDARLWWLVIALALLALVLLWLLIQCRRSKRRGY